MKYKKISSMNDEEKNKMLADLKMKLIKLNLQVSTGTALKKSKEIRDIKKDIARLFTSLNQKQKKVTKTKK
jgi:ribosomal protein L29